MENANMTEWMDIAEQAALIQVAAAELAENAGGDYDLEAARATYAELKSLMTALGKMMED